METITPKDAQYEPASPAPVAPMRPLRRFGKAVLAGSIIAAVGFVSTVAAATNRYSASFLPNTYVADIDVSGMSMTAAKTAVTEAMAGTTDITVTVAGQDLTVSKDALGVTYTIDGALRRAYAVGHTGSVVERFADIAQSLAWTHRVPVSTTVDSQKAVAWVDEMLAPLVKDPVDASITVSNGAVGITPSENGLAIDLEKVTSDLVTAAASSETPKVVVAMNVVAPTVTDASLTTYKSELERLARIPVSLTVDTQTVTPTFAQQITWFTVPAITAGGNESDAITLNTAAVARTVNEIAKKVNQKMVKEQVNADGAVLVAGKDGSTINEQQAVSGIVAQFSNILRAPTQLASAAVSVAVPVTVVPKEQITVTTPQVASDGDATVVPAIDTDAKFIQVNLARQRMYLFENHQLINVFVISSGKAGYETPKGVHQIYSKSVRAWSHAYSLWLPYWNAITPDGKYGIHDLPEWPGGYKETAAHLGTPISHGCIRVGTTQAQYLYAWAPVGTAVVVQ